VQFSGAPPISFLCSSTAEQPVDNRQTVERHHAEGPLSKVVSALTESDAAKAAATFFSRWMAQTDERRIEDPQRWARYPLQRPFLNPLHIVIVAFLVVNETVPVRVRLREPFQFVCKAKDRASGLQVHVTQCKSEAHVHFSSDTREPENSPGLGPGGARGSTGVSDQFHWSVA
jgi:hypothetical protein